MLTDKIHEKMLPVEIKMFIESGNQNQWLTIGDLEVYVRSSHRLSPKHRAKHGILIRCFDIANVACRHKGCGTFTEFLKSLGNLNEHGFQAIYIEQVLSNRFAEYFRHLGWIETNQCGAIPSFFYFLEN